jgi:hypothetical protein
MARRISRSLALALIAVAGADCNQVLGIDAAKLDPSVGAGLLAQCVLNSDCADENVCIFRVCSAPCARDRDCSNGRACLATKGGSACVDPQRSACKSDEQCPSGTACTDGACRTRCDAADANACLSGQSCVNGGCRRSTASDAGAERDAAKNSSQDAGGEPTTDVTDAAAMIDARTPVVDGPMPRRECDGGEKRCMDTLLLTCRSDGQWNAGTQCAYACVDGECSGECVPDDQQCHGSTLRHCDQNGVWQELMTCPKVCSASGCVDKCDAGTHQCSDLDLLTCTNAGEFVLDKTCDYVCKSGACVGECVPDATRCGNGVQETCDANGQWGSPADCEFVCAGNVCGGECVPDDAQCTDGTHVKPCGKNGLWGVPAACSYVCDSNTDDCGGECVPDDTQCTDGTHKKTCGSTGTWGSATACTYVCDSSTDGCGGECVPDDTQCTDGTHKKTCGSTGKWGNPSACNYICDPNSDNCGGSCVPGNYSCNNTAPSTSQSLFCDNGTPMLDDACSYPSELCDAGTGHCAANASYDIGFTSVLPNSSSVSASIMIGNPITLAKRATLLHLGLYGRAKMGTKVKMVLYGDDGSGANSSPSNFITSSDEADLVDGSMLLTLQIAATLNPGKYWVMAVYNGTGGNTHVTSSGGTGGSIYTSQDYLTSFPATFPSSGVTKLPSYDCNHFLEVRNSL